MSSDPRETLMADSLGREPTTGDVVMGYRLGEKLGRGASATVYRALHEERPGDFAVKIINLTGQGAAFADRLEREVSIARRLRHPNLLTIHEAGTTGIGIFSIAMDLATGVAGDQLCDGKQGWLLPAMIAREVALALDYAWREHRLIHRDVKPANILVDRSGLQLRRTVLVDFGLARDTDAGDAGGLTMTGMVLGTPFYLSPEQGRGDRDLDGRSDQYALGATLFHLLAGKPPFPGRTPIETILAHINQPAPDLRTLCPSVPDQLAQVVARCLAKQPAARFPDHGALASALLECIDSRLDEPTASFDPSEPTPTRPVATTGVTGEQALARLLAERMRANRTAPPAKPSTTTRWAGPGTARIRTPPTETLGSGPQIIPEESGPSPINGAIRRPTESWKPSTTETRRKATDAPQPATEIGRVDGEAPTHKAPALPGTGRFIDRNAPTHKAPALPGALEPRAPIPPPVSPAPPIAPPTSTWNQREHGTEELAWTAPAEECAAPAGMFPALQPSSSARPATGSIENGLLVDSHYRIEGLLGAGAGGEVYVVHDQFAKRELALKILTEADQQKPAAVRRFRAESSALSNLDHPAFPFHAGFGTFRGRDYLLMERVRGQDLKHWLKDHGPMGEGQGLAVAHQLAEAMAHAYQRCGMVHRDLKPANLMFVEGFPDRIKIIDLGVSTYLERNELEDFGGERIRIEESEESRIVGTPAYMAPEQAEGAPPSPSMDIYAIGATLYHCLAGVVPFQAPSVNEVLIKHRLGEIPELPASCTASSGTRYLIRRCLAKKPADRFRTWKQFLQAVDSALFSTTTARFRRPQTGAPPTG